MYPHERSLVNRFRDRPFTFLGVNTDHDPEEVKAVMARKGLTKRSWRDGQGGPIAGRYRVDGFPTVLVLDRRGVIRYRQVFGQELEDAVEALLREGG
jgi:hypothetical protein